MHKHTKRVLPSFVEVRKDSIVGFDFHTLKGSSATQPNGVVIWNVMRSVGNGLSVAEDKLDSYLRFLQNSDKSGNKI